MPSVQTVTLLGATGFIGRRLAARLAQKGVFLRLPLRRMEEADAFKLLAPPGQIVCFPSNLKNETHIAAAFAGCDYVVNLIGLRRGAQQKDYLSLYLETAARIARIAHQKDVGGLIHLSSFAADPLSTNPYARAKGTGESAVRAFFKEAVLFRPHPLFGWQDRLLSPWIRFGSFSPLLPFDRGSASKLAPLYVEDVVSAIVSVMEGKGRKSSIFELRGPTLYTLREVGEAVFRGLEKKSFPLPLPHRFAKALGVSNAEYSLSVAPRSKEEALFSLSDLGISPLSLEAFLAERLRG